MARSQEFQEHLHSSDGDPKLLRNWITHQVNTKDENGLTALHKCSKAGHLEKVKYLIQIGAQIDAKDNHGCAWEKGQTPLHFAAANGHFEVNRILMENENPADLLRRTPLHWASWNGNLDICKLIIEKSIIKILPMSMDGHHFTMQPEVVILMFVDSLLII